MPDIAAALDAPPRLIVRRDADPVQYALRRRNLVRAHDHQDILRREDRILREHREERMTREERPREIHQIRDQMILRVRPVASELKAIARLPAAAASCRRHLPDMAAARRIGIILRVRAVRDDENLHILIEPTARPETVPLIALDLLERLPELHAAPLQLDMDERETVDEDRDIVAVRVRRRALARAARHGILMEHLEAVALRLRFIEQLDVLRRAIVAPEILDLIRLDAARLLYDAVACWRDAVLEEPVPLRVAERVVIERLELHAQIRDKLRLAVEIEIRIALLLEEPQERRLELLLRLIRTILRPRLPHILGDDRALLRAGNQIVKHVSFLIAQEKVIFLCRIRIIYNKDFARNLFEML